MVIAASTSVGMKKEWSTSLVPSLVVPVWSKLAAAIWEPLVGSVNTPANAPAHMPLTMAGESPAAVEAQGISVTGIRIGAVMAGSAMMAVGGAFLTMSAFNSFFFEMINGRGWIAIALVVFGSWRPGKALIGAILFAAFDAYQIRLQQLSGGIVPYQLFLMMPYVLSILALVLVARRATYPKALMIPYQKGER